MDYNKLAVDLLLGCSENCADCQYAGDSEFECTIAKLAATAITDLLSRAEAAEVRAEKAERERDAAISDMEALMWHSGDGCQICAHAREVHKEPYVRLECDLREKGKPLDCEPKWRGIKEE